MKSFSKKRSSRGIAAGFLAVGILMLASSIFFNWQVMAFIGLGFVLWGAIFSSAQSGKYVDGTLLDSTAKTVYSTLDRMINDLRYNGHGYYIPSYPQRAYLPEYYKNLKDSIVFIADDSFTGLPAVEELASGKFISEHDRGVFITSPGSGVLNQIEQHLNIDFTTVPLPELCNVLPRCMTEFFNLAEEMNLQILNESTVQLHVVGVLYESLYKPESISKSVSLLGCPVVSAVACALAKSSGKTVMITEQKFWPEGLGVEATFTFIKGAV
jgi:hypothetical protein